MKEKEIEKLEGLLKNRNIDKSLKESLTKKLEILKGNQIVLK